MIPVHDLLAFLSVYQKFDLLLCVLLSVDKALSLHNN